MNDFYFYASSILYVNALSLFESSSKGQVAVNLTQKKYSLKYFVFLYKFLYYDC